MAGVGTALPTIGAIQAAVAEALGIPVSVMREPPSETDAKTAPHAHPRQTAMRLAVLLTDHSYERIGHFFGGRHHTTVLDACRRVDARRTSDAKLHAFMRRVTLDLIRRG